MTRSTEVRHGRVVTPTGVIEDGCVLVRDGRIVRVGSAPTRRRSSGRLIDATDRVVMPGLIDLHGDDIEHQLHPRANASVDPRIALAMADRTNLASGVTTKFHAISFEETPAKNRTVDAAVELAETIAAADDLLVDNRIHARCELSPESVSAVPDLLGSVPIDLVSVMHHTSGDGQLADGEAFTDLYVSEKGCTVDEAERLRDERESMSTETVRTWTRQLVGRLTNAGVVTAFHDVASPDSVEWMADLGIGVAEYPVTMAAIRRAAELGMTTAMGAPNLVRGGSLWDNLSAERAVRAGMLDVLCSDYHPPSLLTAVFVETGESLSDRVARVTRNPADAVGLSDRGRVETGARADLIVVDPDPVPTVDTVLVDGAEQFGTDAAARPDSPRVR